MAQIKQHSRRSKKGKTIIVHAHKRQVEVAPKKASTDRTKLYRELKTIAENLIEDKVQAKEVLKKYQKHPHNLKMMVNATWKDAKVKKWRTIDGERKEVTETVRHLNFNNEQWEQLLKDNSGLTYKIVSRYNFKPEFSEDLYQEARRAIYDAANNYEAKYNPENPPDATRHFASQIAGYVQAEIGRHLATRMQMPYQKRVMFTKFRQAFEKHNGDYDAIYKELAIRKKDIYPNIPEGGDEPLPREGYVTIVKRDVLEKKTKAFEKKVNATNERHDKEIEKIESRYHGKITDEDLEIYDAGIRAFDKELDKLGESKKKEGADIVDINRQIKETESRKNAFLVEMRPLSDEEYESQKDQIEKSRQIELRAANKKLNTDIERTTIGGADKLFKEFEEVMSFKDYSLTETKDYGEGEAVNIEELVAPADSITPEEEIIIRSEFKIALDKFMNKVEMLTPRSAELLKLHLGLHDKSELYRHGLWGAPMTNNEIVNVLPNDFFPRLDKDTGDVKLDYAKRHKGWKAREPKRVQKIKRDANEFKKVTKDWEKRRASAKKTISSFLKNNPDITRVQKQKFRDKTYSKAKVTYNDKPLSFKEAKIPKAQYDAQVRDWNATKPTKFLGREAALKRISKELDIAKVGIRRLVEGQEVKELLSTYRSMRRYSIRKGFVKIDILKAIMFDNFFGITYYNPPENMILKAWHKVKDVARKIKKALA